MAVVQSNQYTYSCHRKLNIYNGRHFEAMCDELLSSHPYYVRGEEQAVCDGAIYVGKNPLPPNAVDRHYVVLEDTTSSNLLPVDYKTSIGRVIFWTGEKGTRHGVRVWMLRISVPQALACTALIVQFPQNQDFVALVPLVWLRKRLSSLRNWGDMNKDLYFMTPSVPFGFHKPGVIPLQFTPFLMPLRKLPEALNSMRRHYLDPATPWYNPWIRRVIVGQDLLLGAQNSLNLTRQSLGMQGDSRLKKLIYTALKTHSTLFSMDFPNHFFTGDIVLLHRNTGTRIHVEFKDGLCHTDNSAQPTRLTHQRANIGDQLYFTSRYKWDFLWTTVASDSARTAQAYLFSRDEIPDQWWDNLTPLEVTRTETWNAPSGFFFTDRQINMGDPQRMVSDLERILLSFANTHAGSFKAQRPSNDNLVGDLPDAFDEEGGKDIEFEMDDELETGVPFTKKSKGSQGTVVAANAFRHEITVYTDIMNVCLQRKKGFVVFLGTGGPSRFAYLQHNWSDVEVTKYKQDQSLPRDFALQNPGTRCMLMNFFSSESWYRASTWASMPAKLQMTDYFQHFRPSFIILDPAPGRKNREHPKLLFPSALWNTEKAYGKVERVERLDLDIFDGAASNLFKIRNLKIHDLLEQCLSQPFDRPQIQFGIDQSVVVRLDDYVVAVRDVYRHFIRYMDPDIVTYRKAGAVDEDEGDETE